MRSDDRGRTEGKIAGSVDGAGLAALILDSVTQPILVLDDELSVILISPSCCASLRVDSEKASGQNLFQTHDHLFNVPPLRELVEELRSGRTAVRDREFEHEFATVGRRILRVNGRRDAGRGLIVLAIEDVTEKRAHERELAASTERFRIFVENVREYAVFMMDEETKITMWNPGAERILGWTEEEILGRTGDLVFTPEDRAAGVPEREMEVARVEGQSLDERWHIRKDGSRFWASGVMVALKEDGATRGFAKILRDNTRRKRAETAIEESHRWLQRILEVTPDIVAMYDLEEDRLGFVSPHLISDLGYEPADFYRIDRESIGRLLHPDDRAGAAAVRRALQEGGSTVPREVRVRVFDAEGRQRWFDARVVPFRYDEVGKLREVLVVARDFTDMHDTQSELHRLMETLEKRVEERTAQVRALASMLTMAEQQERRRISQILHDDLQQRLYGIQMKLSSVRRSAEATESERLMRDARDAEQWLRDAIDLTRDLTVELSPPVLRGDGLVDALHWLVAQIERMYGLHVVVYAADAFVIPDEDMRVLLFQIVRELLFNVVKHAGVDRALVELRQEDGGLIIRVSDEGRGFDVDEAASRSSGNKPFGLFSVKERLRLFGGNVTVRSEPGEGTTVEVHARRVLVDSDSN